MADATITIGADSAQAQATLAELKQLTDELFKGIGVSAEQAAAAQQTLIDSLNKSNLTLKEANDVTAALRPQFEQITTATDAFDQGIDKLSKRVLTVGFVLSILKQNLKDVQEFMKPLIVDVREMAIEAGYSADAIDLLGTALQGLTNPGKAANAVLELHSSLLEKALVAAGRLEEGELGVARAVRSYTKEARESREALLQRAAAMDQIVAKERELGEVTGQTREEVEQVTRAFEKSGVEIPPTFDETRRSLEILTKEEEKLGDEAERRAAKQEKANERAAKSAEAASKKLQQEAERRAEKLAKETAELEKQFSAEDKLIPKLMEFAEGKKAGTAAIDDAVRALKEEISLLEQEAKAAEDAAKSAQGKLQDASKRRAELEGKSVLSVEEAEELLELQLQTSQLQADAANTAEDAAQATFEYGQASSELAGSLDDSGRAGDYAAEVYSRLEGATNDLNKAIAGAGSEAADFSDVVMTDVVRGSNMAGDAIEDDFIGPVKRSEQLITNFTNTVSDAGESFNGFADEASGVAQAAPAAADGIAQVGDELRNLPDDKDETGLGKAKSDSEALANTLLPRILELVKEIQKEAGAITLGGGGAGI